MRTGLSSPLDGHIGSKARERSTPTGREKSSPVAFVDKASTLAGHTEIELILLFAAVADTLSFTKAAQRLGIDQSWLSHKIRQFEASIGLNLFLRNTRNVELTATGKALQDSARRLSAIASQAREVVELLRTSMTGAVRIGALPFSFPDAQRARLIDRFMIAHPDVQIAITNGPTPVLLDQVRSGRIDLAFVSSPFDTNGLDLLLLRESPYCLLMREDHPLAALPTLSAEALHGVSMIIPSKHFSPDAYDAYYRPLIDAGIVPVEVPEFQGTVNYASEWRLPVACTQYTADYIIRPGLLTRPLDFVPNCKKYMVRLTNHRTPLQTLLWDLAESDRLN